MITLWYAGTVLAAALLVTFALWSASTPSARSRLVMLFAGLVTVTYLAQTDLLGRPKPIHLEWWGGPEEAEVLASRIEENEAIYLWLQLPEQSAPVAYTFPWNRNLAEQLQAAVDQTRKAGGTVMTTLPFEHSFDREPRFYARPPAKLPDKAIPALDPWYSDGFGQGHIARPVIP